MTRKPLWLVWMITNIVVIYSQMSISIDHEDKVKKPGPYYRVVLISLAIGIIMGTLVALSSESEASMSLLIGGVFFVCFLAPYSFIFYLRKKRYEDME